MDSKKSFTLIELVISIAIILLFTGVSIPVYTTYNQQVKLKKEQHQFASYIELVKKKSFTGDLFDPTCTDFNGYRITVAASSYQVDFICSWSYQKVHSYSFDSLVRVVQGTGTFVFPPLGANINITTGNIRLRNSAINQCADIGVSAIGTVSISDDLYGC